MKKLVFIALALFATTGIFAQEKMKDKKMSSSSTKMNKMHGKMQDCVMMEKGKMMVMKDGTEMTMNENMTMKNGATVMTDGTVKMKNGQTRMLKEGECVYMDGKMGMMKMDKMKSGKKG